MFINDAIKYANGLETKGLWINQSPKERRRYLLSIANKMAHWEEREQLIYVISEMNEQELMKGLSDEKERQEKSDD